MAGRTGLTLVRVPRQSISRVENSPIKNPLKHYFKPARTIGKLKLELVFLERETQKKLPEH